MCHSFGIDFLDSTIDNKTVSESGDSDSFTDRNTALDTMCH